MRQDSVATVFFHFAVQFLCLKRCAYGGSAVPRGGGGVTWQPSPRGCRGTVFPGVGKDKGGRGGGTTHTPHALEGAWGPTGREASGGGGEGGAAHNSRPR